MESSEPVDYLLLPNGIYEDGSEPFSQASIIQHTDFKLIWKVKAVLSDESFKQLEDSFLGHIIKIASKSFKFSGKLFHYIMMRRLKTKGNNLWLRIASQPTRFSMREFFLSTGIHCEKLDTDQSRKGKKPAKKPYSWTSRKDLTLSNLEDYLFFEPKDITDLEKTEETEAPMEEDEKLCLAAVILTEAFLMTPHSLEKIPSSRLHHASDFEAYTSLAWGKEAYNVLATSIKRMDTNTWARGQYEVKGFPLALLIWSFSAVPLFGATFAVCNDTSKCVYPLYSNWESSLTPRLDQIVDAVQSSDCIKVKSIIGDPEEYKHLVEETHVDDKEFEDIVHLVMRGYILKEIDWRNKIVEYISAEAELWQQLSDSAKLEKILKLVADFNRRLEILEVVLKVRNNMGTYNESELEGDKDKSEEQAGQSNPHEDTGKEDRVFNENVNSTFEDSFRQTNTQDGSYAGDDENTEKSDNSDNAEEGTPRDKSNTPSHSTPKFNLFSQESQEKV